MLSPTAATIRLTLRVLAACIWVGGQFTLGALVPVLRGYEGVTKVAARAFNRLAWPAFVVLVLTGVWNLMEVDVTDAPTAYQVTVFVKILVAAASGIAAAAHINATTKVALAVGGAVGALTAIAAVFLGVLLRAGSY